MTLKGPAETIPMGLVPSIEDGAFRPIQYLGNKWRVLGRLERLIGSEAAVGSGVADVFCGSGVVAQRLSATHPVYASDIQDYARIITSALVAPSKSDPSAYDSLFERASDLVDSGATGAFGDLLAGEREVLDAGARGDQDLADFLELAPVGRIRDKPVGRLSGLMDAARDELQGADSWAVSRLFHGGLYFSLRQALELDALVVAINERPEAERVTAMACVLSVASELSSTVGNQFAQPIRPRSKDGAVKASALLGLRRQWGRSALDLLRPWAKRYLQVPEPKYRGTVTRSDFRQAICGLPDSVQLVYADPPYTRDHYSRFYHVLESLAAGAGDPTQKLVASGARSGRAMYPGGRHQSPFSIKSKVLQAFDALFSLSARSRKSVVLSYSPYASGTVARPQPRLVRVDQIESIAAIYFAEVNTISAGTLMHSRLNRRNVSRLAEDEAELFVVASKPRTLGFSLARAAKSASSL